MKIDVLPLLKEVVEKRYPGLDDVVDLGGKLTQIIAKLSDTESKNKEAESLLVQAKKRFFQALDDTVAVVSALESIPPPLLRAAKNSYDIGRKMLHEGLELAAKIDPKFQAETLTARLFPQELFQLIAQNNIGMKHTKEEIEGIMLSHAKEDEWVVSYNKNYEEEEERWRVFLKQSDRVTSFPIDLQEKSILNALVERKKSCLSQDDLNQTKKIGKK